MREIAKPCVKAINISIRRVKNLSKSATSQTKFPARAELQ